MSPGQAFPEIIDLESIFGDPAARPSVSCTPIGDVRKTDHVRNDVSVRVSSHVIIVPTAGMGSHVVDMATYTVEPGSVIHVQPGQVQRWLLDGEFDGWAIVIAPHVCPPGLFDLTSPSPKVVLGTSIEVAKSLVASLTEPDLLPPKAQARLRLSIAAVLLELIASAGEGPTIPPELSSEQAIVSDFRRELEFHYLTSRSVTDYAKLIGCSPKTLTRATNRVLGQTPKQVIDARVTYAASRLLANTDISISWISTKLGFSQQSNFAKFFARQVGLTPAAYRSDFSTTR